MQPDIAVVNAMLQTHDPANAAAATGQNEAIYERIVAAVTALGVARDDITLSYYNVNYVAPPPNERDQASYGFSVNRSFAIKVRRIALAGRVVDAAIEAGATNINGVTFGLADMSAASNEAMQRAVADATQRAQALARDAGLHVVGIASMVVGANYSPFPVARLAVMAAPAPEPPTTFDSGNATVNVTVTMVFLAKP